MGKTKIDINETVKKKITIISKNMLSILTAPIRNHFPFVLAVVLLLIIPNYLDSFIFNYDGVPIMEKINKNHHGVSIPQVFFMPFLFAYLCASLPSNKWGHYFRCMVLALIAFLFGVNIFLLFNFKSQVTPMVFVLLMETNAEESSEFVSTFLFCGNSLKAYLCISLTILIIWTLYRYRKRISMWFSVLPVQILILLSCIYLLARGVPLTCKFLDLYDSKNSYDVEVFAGGFGARTNMITELLYSVHAISFYKEEARQAVEITMKAADSHPIQTHPDDSVYMVVVIGESFNKYHTPIYGYNLPTTPRMSEELDSARLFAFSDVISSWNLTSNSIKNILSTNCVGKGEQWSDLPFFPVIFKSAGYKVYFWDNQNSGAKGDAFDFSLNGIIHNKDLAKVSYDYENSETYQYDNDLIDSFSSVYHRSKNDLVILHIKGQHIGAKYRYPDTYGPFKADDIARADLNKEKRQRVAEYDNAIHYNDMIMGRLFDMFSNCNAIIVFFSDHGEEVYDYRDVIGRTHESTKTRNNLKYQFDVPLFIWCSDTYKEHYPDVIERIIESQDKAFMTDCVSHVLFDLGNISTSFYSSEKDVLSNDFVPYKRIVQGNIDYDKIK